MGEDLTDETIRQLCELATRDHYEGIPVDSPLLERAPTADLLRTDADGNVFIVQTPQSYTVTPTVRSAKLNELAFINKKQFMNDRKSPARKNQSMVNATKGESAKKDGHHLALRTTVEDSQCRGSARFSRHVTSTRIPRQTLCTDLAPDETGRTQSERRQIYFSRRHNDGRCDNTLSRLHASTALKRLRHLKSRRKRSSESDVADAGGKMSQDGVSSGRSVDVQVGRDVAKLVTCV